MHKFCCVSGVVPILLLSSLLTSCVVIPQNRLVYGDDVIQPQLDDKAIKANIGYAIETADVSSPSTGQPWWYLSATEASIQVANALNSSGYFSTISEGASDKDVFLRIRIEFSMSPYVYPVAALCGITFTLLPTWMTHDYTLFALVHSSGGKTNRYVLRDQCIEYRWLPLVLAAPARTISSAAESVTTNAVNMLVRKMIVDGLLPVTEGSKSTPAALADSYEKPRADVSRTPRSTGSGFFVTTNGFFLTSHHVLRDSSDISIYHKSVKYKAVVVDSDAVNDVALLKVDGVFDALPLGDISAIKLGSPVFTVGFPNPDLQGFDAKYTSGEVNSLRGVGGDIRMFQVSVPVQPGNSGGPLVNSAGQVIGVINSRLNDLVALEQSGSLPQNVNYALKLSYVMPLIKHTAAFVSLLPESLYPDDAIKSTESAVGLVITY